jgi:hypothetical protein
MPVPNELTPEEEQEFTRMGVEPAGQGSEPVIENDGDRQQQGQQDDQGQQHGDRGAPARDERGRFVSREEREALQGQQQGQQQGDQGQQDDQQQGQQGEPKMVPLEALHAERARVREMAQRMQTLTARTNMLLTQRGDQGQQQDQQMPSLADDPAGYIQALEARLERFEQGWQQDQQTRQLDSSLENDESIFALQKPDYHKASDYYVNSRARELLQFYPPEQAQEMLLKEAREIAKQSWARGLSAAETIYNLSLARGYNPNTPNREGNQGQQGQQGQGQQRGGPSAQDIVNGVRNGQQASRSLSGGAGGGRTAELNADALLNMSDEEFEAHLALGTKGANARFAAIG